MSNRVLVCVTKQKTCERLIKTGARLAKEAGDAELLVVHVLHRDDNILGNMMQGDALEFLFKISKQVGADMTVLRSEKVIETLIEYAKKNEVSTIVVGEAPKNAKRDLGIITHLQQELPTATVMVIPSKG